MPQPERRSARSFGFREGRVNLHSKAQVDNLLAMIPVR